LTTNKLVINLHITETVTGWHYLIILKHPQCCKPVCVVDRPSEAFAMADVGFKLCRCEAW